MRASRPASLRVISRIGVDMAISWAADIVVPAGVAVEVVDLGWRCDIIAVSGDETVGLIGDLGTGDRVLSATMELSSPLVSLALDVFARLYQASSVRRPSTGSASPLWLLAEHDDDAIWLPDGTEPH